MWKFPLFQSAVKRMPCLMGHQPVSIFGNGAPKAEIPSMVSSDEMAFFSESAARYVGKKGAIVDLGCWLGSTSIALAQGILSRNNGATREEKVLGFDRFAWESWMPEHRPYCLYRLGESFLPETRRIVRDHGGGRVELIQADLGHYEWKDGPIKILLVDAMKNEDIARQIAHSFYPNLITGGLLIHQDFKHYYTSWIHVIQYRLRRYFRFDRSVPASATVAFEVLADIPREAVDQATDLVRISDNEIDASFRHSIHLVGPGEEVNVAAAHVMQYVHLGRKDRAFETLEPYRSLGMSDRGEFPKVLNCLNQIA
jgi:hypothetical protein